MRITCVGGGPGGLFFAALMAQRAPEHQVTVLERDPPGSTFGFGVVFSERTLGGLAAVDPVLERRLASIGVDWTDIEVRHRGRRLRAGGNAFVAASRKQLLAILRERAVEAGVDVRHVPQVEDYEALMDANDLVVAADGVGSGARGRFAARLRPTVELGSARYIWFATPQPFDALTFVFTESEHGWFGAHAYPFEPGMSTFIVECDEATWRRAGLDATDGALERAATNQAARAYLEDLFADTIDGHGLVGNASQWARFRTVRNGAWTHRNLVLIGDAAHTAHFSVGSGTKMAMEDAVALADALTAEPCSPAEALAAYEAARRPAVARIQNAAYPSIAWWERFPRWMRFEPEQLTYHFLTRSQRVTHDNLRLRDRRLAAEVERWHAHRSPGCDARLGPLSAPLSARGLSLPNRVVAEVRVDADETDPVQLAVCVAAPARAGAGAVLVRSPRADAAPEHGPWAQVRGSLRRNADARLWLTVPAAAARSGVSAAAAAGADAVVLTGLMLDDPDVLSALPDTGGEIPVIAEIMLSDQPLAAAEAQALAVGTALRERGVAAVGVALASRTSPAASADRLAVCDALRNELGLVTGLHGDIADNDALVTAVLAGRVDYGTGRQTVVCGAWLDDAVARSDERQVAGTA